MVANTAHQNGSAKSATNPNPPNVNQNIFFCTPLFYPKYPAQAAPDPVTHSNQQARAFLWLWVTFQFS
jgi:hypothetical protein